MFIRLTDRLMLLAGSPDSYCRVLATMAVSELLRWSIRLKSIPGNFSTCSAVVSSDHVQTFIPCSDQTGR